MRMDPLVQEVPATAEGVDIMVVMELEVEVAPMVEAVKTAPVTLGVSAAASILAVYL